MGSVQPRIENKYAKAKSIINKGNNIATWSYTYTQKE